MKKGKAFISTLLLFTLFATFSTLNAQEDPKDETPYWYVASYKIAWEKVDSLQSLIKLYTIPISVEVKKSGGLLDYKVLIHHTGGEYNVVIMSKYPSWAAIDKEIGWGDAFKKIEPDKAKQKEVSDAFSWIFEGSVHIDNIYKEVELSTDK